LPVVENETTGPNNTSTIIITNKTFNSTYRQVKITINDAENFTKYDVYAYSEEPYFAGNQTFLNESNEIVTDRLQK
jgi:arabinogalactan endo-1,4-beta-galactosidase